MWKCLNKIFDNNNNNDWTKNRFLCNCERYQWKGVLLNSQNEHGYPLVLSLMLSPPPMTARLTHSVSGVKMYSFTNITMTLQFPGNVSTIHLELSNSEHHHKILTCQIPLCRLVWAKSTRCQLGHSEGWWKATLSANGWDWCVNC